MSKKPVLEMFKEIKELEVDSTYPITTVQDLLPFFCEKVDEALQRLEQIDSTNPSEAMESLENLYIVGNLKLDYVTSDKHKQDYSIVKQYILKSQEMEKEIDRLDDQCLDVLGDNIKLKNKSQEQEKVLEIIFKKNVDVDMIKNYQTVIEYNWNIRFEKYKRKELIEEEFDLLKRYCENGNNL